MRDRKPISTPWTIAVVPMVLSMYVGAYYATVWPLGETGIQKYLGGARVWIEVEPRYGYPAIERWLAPVHWLDRRIRPHVWEL